MLDSVARADGVSTSQVIKTGLELVARARQVSDQARLPLYPRLVDEEEIDDAVERATSAACEVLDELMATMSKRLPELNGISSNFQGLLADHIRAMLTGAENASKGHRTHLTPLFYSGRFRRIAPLQGPLQGYSMVRTAAKAGDPALYFVDDRGWVPLEALGAGDLYTSAEAALTAVLKAMRNQGDSPREMPMKLTILDFSTDRLTPLSDPWHLNAPTGNA